MECSCKVCRYRENVKKRLGELYDKIQFYIPNPTNLSKSEVEGEDVMAIRDMQVNIGIYLLEGNLEKASEELERLKGLYPRCKSIIDRFGGMEGIEAIYSNLEKISEAFRKALEELE